MTSLSGVGQENQVTLVWRIFLVVHLGYACVAKVSETVRGVKGWKSHKKTQNGSGKDQDKMALPWSLKQLYLKKIKIDHCAIKPYFSTLV